MLGISLFVLVIVALFFLFRFKRQREIKAFMEAEYTAFVVEKNRSLADGSETPNASARVIGAAVENHENRNAEAGGSSESRVVYRKRDAVFDEVTRSLLITLYQVLDNGFQVLVKVPLADLVRSEQSDSRGNFTERAKVDFVICRKADLKVVCGIQLAGGGADSIAAIFRQVDLPFITLSVGSSYSADELKDMLHEILPAGE
jgi:hypothetical protein